MAPRRRADFFFTYSPGAVEAIVLSIEVDRPLPSIAVAAADVADSFFANAGSGRRWRRRRASSAS
jgi:hypothetical protein